MLKRKTFLGLLAIVGIVIVAVLLLPKADVQEPTHEHYSASEVIRATPNIPQKTETVQNLSAKAKGTQLTEYTPGQIQAVGILSDEDIDVEDLTEPSLLDAARKASMLLENPIHSGRIKLQTQMRDETPQESFANLTDNDNIAMLTPLMGGQPFSPGYYAADIRTMCKMARIRKLLADARENPEHISSFLKEQLLTMNEKFPLAYEEFMQLIKNKSPGTKLTTSELRDVQKYRLLSTAAVYVLSEINAYDSLPLMAKLSTQGKVAQRPDFAGNCQINPKFLLYAMHKLVKEFPEDQLSEEATKRRLDYLVMAKKLGVPDTAKVYVAAWDAYYQEDDFRKRRLGKKLYTENQPVIELTEFPQLNKLSSGKTKGLLRSIGTFVDTAFPG